MQEPITLVSKINKLKVIKPDTILNSVSANVDGQRFIITCNNNDNLLLISGKGDTLYQDSIYSCKQEFVDFNGDGYEDVLIDYMTNTPGMMDLLLYDKVEKTYKKVIDL